MPDTEAVEVTPVLGLMVAGAYNREVDMGDADATPKAAQPINVRAATTIVLDGREGASQ